MVGLHSSLLELIRRSSAEIPDDVQRAILASLEREKKGTIGESALKIIEHNIDLAPIGFNQITFEQTARAAVKEGAANRLPVSYFVSVSYSCRAYRSQGVELDSDDEISKWLD